MLHQCGLLGCANTDITNAMYSQFQGDGRPTIGQDGRPISSGGNTFSVEDIIAFAQNEAKQTWDELGLAGIVLPKIAYGLTTEYLSDPDAPVSVINPKTGKITLSRQKKGEWSKAEFAQALLVEMGNYKNKDVLKSTKDSVKAYPSADSYARAIEIIEYSSFIIVCRAAYLDSSPLTPPIWSGVPGSFEDYYTSAKAASHVNAYKEEWESAR